MPLIDGYNISIIWRMPGCHDGLTLNDVVDASQLIPQVHAFIGPECSKAVESIALLARGWDTAVVS